MKNPINTVLLLAFLSLFSLNVNADYVLSDKQLNYCKAIAYNSYEVAFYRDSGLSVKETFDIISHEYPESTYEEDVKRYKAIQIVYSNFSELAPDELYNTVRKECLLRVSGFK